MIKKESNSRKVGETSNRERPIGLQKVLVVEWEAELRSDMVSAAGEAGFEATACTTPAEARQLVEANDFEGMVFDANLYGESGETFVAWLSSLGAARPYTIAAVDEELAGECGDWLEDGVDDLLTKPFAPEALRARLAVMETRLAERRRGSDELEVLRRAHGRFESLFLEAPDAILILKNRQGKVIGVNRAVKEVLGYDGKALLGKYMSLVFPDIFGRDGLASRGDVLSGATALQGVPYRGPGGEARHLDIVMSAVPWDRGYAVMMVCRDVSSRECAEGGRIQGSKEDALRRFAGGVSAEFGDVLTSLGGNLSMAGAAPFLNEDAREAIAMAQGACERGRELTADLARLGGAGRAPRRAPLALDELAEKAVQFALFDHEGVRPLVRASEELRKVEGDDGQVRKVIEAVAQNAAEALSESGPSGGGQLSLELDNFDQPRGGDLPMREGEYVRLGMRDNGPGIPAGDLQRVSDPYFAGREGSRGFGLAQAAAIVRAHGGHLAVDSKPGAGTTVEIYLPACEGGGERAPAASETGALRVLVLDDEPNIRTMLDKALTGAGHEVFCAATGEEAFRAFEKADDFGRPFDVLLFDLDIRGGMGGQETLARIRATHPGVKAIVTTGFVDDQVLENYLEHGFCGVLCKPFRLEHLTAAVERLGK